MPAMLEALRVLVERGAQLRLGFKYGRRFTIKCFSANQIGNNSFCDKLPINDDEVSADFGHLRKWDAGWSAAERHACAGHQFGKCFRDAKSKQ